MRPDRLKGVTALLFDLDGTLVRPTIDFAALNRAVRDTIASYGAREALADRMPALEALASAPAWLRERGLPGADELVREGTQRVLDIELAAADAALPFEGVSDMLAALRARGLCSAIVTRNSRAAAERILERGKLVYDVLLTRDDVTRVKPAPDHLTAALHALGAAPGAALMCGDHVMDIEAGIRAGIDAVGVLSGASGREELLAAGALMVLERVTELTGYLD